MVYARLITSLLVNRILYLGEKSYLVDKDGEIKEVGLDYAEKARLVILGKNHYFETLKTFPFSSVKEIRSAVKTDIHAFSPFETDLFFVRRIGETGEKTSVNLWFVNKAGCERLQTLSPLFILPETALLPSVKGPYPIVYSVRKTDNDHLLSFVNEDGAARSMSLHGTQMDITHFKRAVGGDAKEYPVKAVTKWEDYLAMLQEALYDMPKKDFPIFTKPDYLSMNFNKRTWSVGIAVAAGLFFLYTGLSVLMPYLAAKDLDAEDKAISSNLSGLLAKQDRIDSTYQRHIALAERLARYTNKTGILNLLNTVLPEDTAIRQFTVAGNLVEMRGMVPKATVLLSALTQVKEVKKAKFTTPLRQDSKTGMEVFTLTFVYEQDKGLSEGIR
jgi:hypothetical protein